MGLCLLHSSSVAGIEESMKVWVAIIPDNELLGVFTTRESCQKAIDEAPGAEQWIGWGSMEPRECDLDEVLEPV